VIICAIQTAATSEKTFDAFCDKWRVRVNVYRSLCPCSSVRSIQLIWSSPWHCLIM